MYQCLNITNSGFPGGLLCRSRNRGSLCAKKRPCLTIGDVYLQVSPECSNLLMNEITLLPHKVLFIESGPLKETEGVLRMSLLVDLYPYRKSLGTSSEATGLVDRLMTNTDEDLQNVCSHDHTRLNTNCYM